MAGIDATEVNARVVYWGIEGSGKTSNLNAVYAKLRPDHRSEIRQQPTPFDPTVVYEVLPIELGEIAGVRTRLQIISAPAGAEQAPTRKQLLDRVDGVVLVIDAQPERRDENLACYQELRQALAAYGRRIDRIPLVVQYNKRDLGDPYAMESLHRKLDVGPAPVFEAVASEGTGVLQTLSTISKRVIRSLREQERAELARGVGAEGAPTPEPPPAAAPAPPPVAEPLAPQADWAPEAQDAPPAQPSQRAHIEQALAEVEARPQAAQAARDVEEAFEAPEWEPEVGEPPRPNGSGLQLSIVSVGEAERVGERRVRVPLVLEDGSGQTVRFAVSIELDPLLDEAG